MRLAEFTDKGLMYESRMFVCVSDIAAMKMLLTHLETKMERESSSILNPNELKPFALHLISSSSSPLLVSSLLSRLV
jgi:hypothetical protein